MANASNGPPPLPQRDSSHSYLASSLDQPSSPARRYNCSICSTSFRRREHFERHLHSHTRSRDFQCDVCGKQFSRRDTLQRHSRIHGQVPSQARRMLPRASHACINCMKSKQRCSGLHPCDRCNRRDWLCRFPKDPKEVGLQRPEIPTEATEQRTINETDPELERNDNSEPPQVSELASVDVPYSDPRRLESANFTSEPCVDFTLPGHTGQFAGYNDATSIFESFLLWPLDGVSGHSNMALTNPSIPQTPSAIARTVNQSTNMPFGPDTTVDLASFSQHAADYAEKTSGLSCITQSEIAVPENALTEEDRDILKSEDYGHIPKPSILVYEMFCGFHKDVSRSSPEAPLPSLYSLDILHVCIQLYFEHFHRKFPTLHQGTFEARSSSWLLYLAVAAVGSQYSRLSFRTKISSDLIKSIRLSLLQKLNSAMSLQTNLELAQATLLFNVSLLFSGRLDDTMHFQYQRNMLVTMCRPLLMPNILFANSCMSSTFSLQAGDWALWIATESWQRIVYFTWLIECFQMVFQDLPPLITVGDLHLNMPCNDELWQCTSVHEWEHARALQRDQSLSVLSLLKMEVIDQDRIHMLSASAKFMSLFAVYAAEKQYSSMHDIAHFLKIPSVYPSGCMNEANDTILECFQHATSQHRQESPILTLVMKFSLVLRLLRFIEYRPLYISSGWMAQRQEVETAVQHITQLLHAKPRQARQSLLYAAQLFRIIRSQQQFDPYDAFLLLVATLYIWNFDRFVISDKSQYPPDGSANETFRIDQTLNEDVEKEWVEGTFKARKQLHISGIGVLNGEDSVSRILRESGRILDHDKAWSHQANGIKFAMHQVLLGKAPGFPKEAE